jgi:site-specific recombinase XerD
MAVRPHPTKHKRYPGKTWWIIDLGHGANRTRSPFEGSFEAALSFEKSIRQQNPEEVSSVSPYIKELIIPFLRWYEHEAAAKTMRDYRFTIDLYIVPFFGNLRPIQLNISVFSEFKSALIDKGLAPATINKHINYFSTLLKWAADEGHCQPISFKIPRFAKKRTAAEPKRPLTQRQLDAIYKHIRPHYRLPFLLMSDLGLRLEEAMALKVEDIDEAHKIVNVLGKGNKYRKVPFMSDRFEDELNKILDVKMEGHLTISEKTGERHVTMWKELKRAVKEAGLSRPGINQHLLRHTFATLAAESGMNPHALQRILGHASIETTNKIYTNVGRDFVGDEGRKLRESKRVSI